MIYYTRDLHCDGDHIAENADIETAAGLSDLPKIESAIGWKEGDWGDCWVRSYMPLTDEEATGRLGIPCKVRAPGTHPGGKCYWVTPSVPVMVPVYPSLID